MKKSLSSSHLMHSNMMFIVFIYLLIDISRSLEWNCMENKHVFIANEQCTITVEYLSIDQQPHVCVAHTLSINTLPPLSLASNYSMQTLRVNYCRLIALNQLPFTLPSSVEKLDLSHNLFSTFTLAFPLPSYLKYLHLDDNPNLIDIDFGSNKLIRLSLRHNHQLQLSSLPKSLMELDLTDCNLSQSTMLTLLQSLSKLTHLSLAENQLEHMPRLDQSIQLEYLNLSKNHLTFRHQTWWNKHLHILDLRFNRIKSLEMFDNQTRILQLFLHGNPLHCDCWYGSLRNSSLINITDLSLLQCHSPSDYLCSYTRHCTSDCTCCDFEACDCHSICPSECSCFHDATWSYHLVQCRARHLFDIHHLLPETVTELNYEENGLEELKAFVFMGKTCLTKLNLAKNNLRTLSNETFCGAFNLREINLSSNPNLMIILSNLNELFGCLKQLQYIILSKEQIDRDEPINAGWMVDYEEEFIRVRRMAPTVTTAVSTIFSIYHQESITASSLTDHHQTLLLTVFFLLLFVLLFSLLLLSLAICRRKLRRQFNTELQQHHYCYHPNLHSTSIKLPESNTTSAANDSLYEQLPSLSSDSEQPFLYTERRLPTAPALPPYPPQFRSYHCYHPPEPMLHSNYLLSQPVFLPNTRCRCTETYICPR